MRNGILLGLLLFLAASCTSTKTVTTPETGPTLIQFDKENVSKSEFERVYQKNNGGYEAAKKHNVDQYNEYLDLYIKFKRKVFEAEARGLDTTQAFKQEFETYRKQLAQPYLKAQEVEDKLIKEAYSRSQFVVNASHLLINVDENAPPTDTLLGYTKIMAFRDTIMKKIKPFEAMAAAHSDDPSAVTNQGKLGYFSAFDMVYPFENGAFNTPVGNVSMPVRTRFGYHIIKVNDKIKTGGTKRAAHIIVRIGERYSAKDTAQAIARINEIYEMLRTKDFAEVATEYSDDPSSAGKGGDLGDSRLLPEMEDIKLKLAEGSYSKPFTTRFGWHILKVTEVAGAATFDEAEPELRRKIERDSRSQISRTALINRIKSENTFELNEANFTALKATLNANFPRGTWTAKEVEYATMVLPLFTLGKKKTEMLVVTNRDFANYYTKQRPRNPKMNANQAADKVLKEFIDARLIEFEESKLAEKNPEYGHLLKEYRDGILLFTLMEQMVWKKAVEDTLGLMDFYQNNQDEFQANRSIDVKEYRTSEESVIHKVARLMKLKVTDQEMDSLINKESALKLSIRTVTYEDGKDDIDPNLFEQPIGYTTGVTQVGDSYRIMRIQEARPAGIKPFDKAKSEAITKYQDFLEREWLRDLEYKYPAKVNEDVFDTLFN